MTSVRPLLEVDKFIKNVHFSAVILGSKNQYFFIEKDGLVMTANKAASCLISVAPGDEVLVAVVDSKYWITSVLEQKVKKVKMLEFNGDLVLDAKGCISMKSHMSVSISAKDKARVESKNLELNSSVLRFAGNAIEMLAEQIEVKTHKLKQVADKVQNGFSDVMESVGNSFRKVTGHDENRSGSYRHSIDDSYVIECTNSVQVAKKNMHLDANKIHMG